MLKMTELSDKGLVTIAFDRAGTSNTDPRDAGVNWKDPVQVALSQWFVKYIAASKQAVRPLRTVSLRFASGSRSRSAISPPAPRSQIKTECQRGAVRVICVEGGAVTKLEAREMSRIIEDAKSDATKSGIRCRVSDERMSFFEFLREFDPSWREDDGPR